MEKKPIAINLFPRGSSWKNILWYPKRVMIQIDC